MTAAQIQQQRKRNTFRIALNLARRPGFCCCCILLQRQDARRLKRILRIVRRVTRDW